MGLGDSLMWTSLDEWTAGIQTIWTGEPTGEGTPRTRGPRHAMGPDAFRIRDGSPPTSRITRQGRGFHHHRFEARPLSLTGAAGPRGGGCS